MAGARVLWPGVLALSFLAGAAEIPAPKLELIRRAMHSMKLDARLQALVDARVDAAAQRIRLGNPDAPDSVVEAARRAVAEVHAEHMGGPEGLHARVHAVLHRHLTEEDLRFAVDFRASDGGRRYREVAPRVVGEGLEAARLWGERLEPEVRRRLERDFRGLNLDRL